MNYEYQHLYEVLRQRVESGEFAVGERFPASEQILRQYRVSSLSTMHTTMQMLADDGMIRSEASGAAFVLSTESARAIDPRQAISSAITALGRAQRAITQGNARRVTIDLHNDLTHFAITAALRAWAMSQREKLALAPSEESTTLLVWAETAEAVLKLIEESLQDSRPA